MRSPSARILINRIDIWIGVQGQDADGGYKMTYPSITYADVPATVQVGEYVERYDEQQQWLGQSLTYRIMTAQQYNVKARDQIIWVDNAGISHTLMTQANRDEAGRGGAFTIRATETL